MCFRHRNFIKATLMSTGFCHGLHLLSGFYFNQYTNYPVLLGEGEVGGSEEKKNLSHPFRVLVKQLSPY